MNHILTPRQLAEHLQLTPDTVTAWIKRGWVIGTKLPNGRFVIPASEVDRLTQNGGRP